MTEVFYQRRVVRRVWAVLAAGALLPVLMLSPVSSAQGTRPTNEPPAAPIATVSRESEGSLITLALVFLLAIGIISVNFIPSKRGHQD